MFPFIKTYCYFILWLSIILIMNYHGHNSNTSVSSLSLTSIPSSLHSHRPTNSMFLNYLLCFFVIAAAFSSIFCTPENTAEIVQGLVACLAAFLYRFKSLAPYMLFFQHPQGFFLSTVPEVALAHCWVCKKKKGEKKESKEGRKKTKRKNKKEKE